MGRRIALLGTWDTKANELGHFERLAKEAGLEIIQIDLSTNLPATNDKSTHLKRVRDDVTPLLQGIEQKCDAFVAIGGGTGAEISLQLFQHLGPMTAKFLLAPFTFDPRVATSGMMVTCLFSPVDIKGSGPLLNQAYQQLVGQLTSHAVAEAELPKSPHIALSALGVTEPAITNTLNALEPAQSNISVFHANGFGGVSLARLIDDQTIDFLIDLTPHELTRHLIGGAHAPLGARLSAMSACPSISLPGGLNFLGLGPLKEIDPVLRKRQLFEHSANFTHVVLDEAEMEQVAHRWAELLNASSHRKQVVLPMRGFSTHDAPGGVLENPNLREICRDIVTSNCHHFQIHELDAHINDAETATIVADLFNDWHSTNSTRLK